VSTPDSSDLNSDNRPAINSRLQRRAMADKKINIRRKQLRKMARGPLFWIVLALIVVVA
jgi:hypothetical protein